MAWADFVQGMLMIFAVIVGLFVAFGNTGSLGFVMDGITAINPALASPWTNLITVGDSSIVGVNSEEALHAAGHSQGKMSGLWDCGFDKSLLS